MGRWNGWALRILRRQLQLHSDNLHRFFEQVAFSVMVRNGDAHLKNFAQSLRTGRWP